MRAETVDRTVCRIIVRIRVCCGHDSYGDFGLRRNMVEMDKIEMRLVLLDRYIVFLGSPTTH